MFKAYRAGDKGREQGLEQGRKEGSLMAKQILLRYLVQKETPEKIAEEMALPLEEVLEIIK